MVLKTTYINLFYLIALAGLLSIYSCAKDKEDFQNQPKENEHSASNLRILNLARYKNIKADGKQLTNFTTNIYAPGNNSIPIKVVVNGDTIPYSEDLDSRFTTPYFPYPGSLGQIWNIPEDLFQNNKAVKFDLFTDSTKIASFTSNNPSDKLDYYMIPSVGTGQPLVVPIQRNETPPSRPDYFKIRILNLSKQIPKLPSKAVLGEMEDLFQPYTLTYANGDAVHPTTTTVTVDQQATDYIELPYGTYQFKIMTADGRQLSAVASGDINIDEILPLNPINSNYINFRFRDIYDNLNEKASYITYAPMKTYQPGGIYTIVVSALPFKYKRVSDNDYATYYQNQYKIIEDIPAPMNSTFGKVQGVNGTVRDQISFRFNNKMSNSAFRSGEGSPYEIFNAHSEVLIEALSDGKVLANTKINMEPGQNISCWLYEDEKGGFEVIPVYNDLGNYFYNQMVEDYGKNNRFNQTFFLSTRFLNLTSDIPYANFTVGEGGDMRDLSMLASKYNYWEKHLDEAMYYLKPGKAYTYNPNVRWFSTGLNAFDWRIFYTETAGIKPGTYVPSIAPLLSTKTVTNPELYTRVKRRVPPVEPGFFTLALIGKKNATAANEKARMILIKHNQ